MFGFGWFSCWCGIVIYSFILHRWIDLNSHTYASVENYGAVIQQYGPFFFKMSCLPFSSVCYTQLSFALSALQKHTPASHLQLPFKGAYAFGFVFS